MNILRWILGAPIAAIGAGILCLHLWMFVWGVLCRHHVPSAVPIINVFILFIGFALLPIPHSLAAALAFAAADLVLHTSVNMWRP